MIDPRRLPANLTIQLRTQLESTLEGLRNTRLSFWGHWAQLAEVYCPRRYLWFVTPNQLNKGSQVNAQIVDETGVIAARVCSSGMMSGLTSPTRAWFKLGLEGLDPINFGPVKLWLAECERRMMRVFSESNFYQSLGVLYHDNAIFASAAMIVYDDAEEVIRCYNPALGEFFFGASSRLDVNQLYREFTLTIAQCVEQFGLENLSPSVQQSYRSGGNNRTREIVIAHAIEPNTTLFDGTNELTYAIPPKFPYREVYWERGQSTQYLLSLAGYNEKPFVGARWDTTSNDAYGNRSPGMDAMPATRQLQIQTRRLAEAIDKLVRPPMNASVQMKNEPASILPGAVNYVSDINTAGFKPAYQIEPRVEEMNANIATVQARVNSVFFVDLFMMISQLDTVRTATEISARREEKLIQLGPVIERFENEVLDPLIDRTFSIMLRRGLFPEPPQALSGPINVEYVSMLAEAQKASQTVAIERFLGTIGNVGAAHPLIFDVVNWDAIADTYAEDINVPPNCIQDPQVVAAIRAQRSAQQQASLDAQNSLAAAQGAKTLSQTEVGGGRNALQAVMGQ